MKGTIKACVLTFFVIGSSALAPHLALAQAVDTAGVGATNNAGGLSEIVVTAQRRSESLQDVPISVTAVSANQLENTGVTGIQDLAMNVPSLNVQDGGGYLFMHLRGVGSNTPGAGLENPIALYVDGVYYANQTVGLFSFNNISQIEVLNGPQGTLFGRNSTGGLVQITTASPTQDFQVKADAGASNFHGASGNLYVSGGITQDLAADVAIRGERSGGYGKNFATGEDIYDEPWNVAIRSKFLYTADAWKATLIGDYSNTKNSYDAVAAIPGSYVIRPVLPAPALGTNPWNANTDAQPFVKDIDMGGSLKIERDFGAVTLSNLMAGRRSSFQTQFDDDGTPLPIESLLIQQRDWQVSDELQLASKDSGALRWVAGLYYFYDGSQFDPTTVSFSPDPAFNPLYPVGQLLATAKQDASSIAGYGQATYALSDQFSVTAGLRYTHEHHILTDASENGVLLLPGSPIVPAGPPIPHSSKSFSDPTYRLALDYKVIPDLLIYGSFNTGFKSGGYNTSNPTDPAFAPEKLYAYELGEKLEMFDHKVRLNSALFYYDYKDIQEQKPEQFALGIINGSKAKLYGFDGQLTAVPIKPLELTAGLSLLHTRFESFPDAPLSTPGGGVPTLTGSAAGNQLPYAPKAVVDVAATYYLIPSVSITAIYYRSSSFYFAPDNVVNQGAYNKVNASILWASGDQRLWIRLYGDNLTNATINGDLLTTPLGAQLQTLQPPRVYGLKVGFTY